jgi:cell division protein FtsI (penicillin-binding protein 3)
VSRRRRKNVVDRRIRLLLLVLVLALAASLGRAVWLQAVQAEPLARMAQSQHRETLAIPGRRGTIYDRTGALLALGESATTVYADPRRIRDPEGVAQAAATILGREPAALVGPLSDRDRGFVYLARQANPAKAAELAKLELEGVGFYPEERRAYPQRTVASHVLGYAGIDNEGLAGIEQALDHVLAGAPGSKTIVKDPFGRVIDVLDSSPEREGKDVYLTIDHHIQANAEAVLRQTVKQYGATSASAVVLDPKTGEILALAVAPSFDANNFGSVPPARSRNRAVTDPYEPGSTFKLIPVAAVLSEGLVAPSTPFTLPYQIPVADRWIRDSHERPTQRMTVAEILSVSSNVGTVTLAQMLGERKLADWVQRFGFGEPTGLAYPGESPGIVLPVEQWSGSSIGNIPIGQGIAVTPVQMAASYATIANGGEWIQPHLVSRIDGEKRQAPERRRVVSPEIARTLVGMLRGVVDDGGTGTAARVRGYHVAGKTGTAQKPDPKRGGYSDSRYVASFVGFVPASDPRLVILVSVDEPRGSIWGGVVAAPAFQQIATFGLQYLDVPPDAPLAPSP